jgi:hypothetical protein
VLSADEIHSTVHKEQIPDQGAERGENAGSVQCRNQSLVYS